MDHHVGGIVGYCTQNLSGLTCGGNVTGTYNTGGIVGYTTGTVSGSTNNGSIKGTYYTGGVVGYTTNGVSSCYNYNDVEGTYCVGGIVGYLDGDSKNITSCENGTFATKNGKLIKAIAIGTPADDDTGAFVGGVVGRFRDNSGKTGAITSCKNYFKVQATLQATQNDTNTKYIGGICGRSYMAAACNGCTNDGNIGVSGSAAYYIGGIIGACRHLLCRWHHGQLGCATRSEG